MAMFSQTASTGVSSTTSSTPTTKVTHTVTSPTGRKYIIFFACDIDSGNTGTRCKVDLYVDGVLVATFSPRVQNTSEQHNIFFFEQVTGKTSNFDCEIRFSSTNNTNTVNIQNARIVSWDYTALESALDIQYGADNTNRSLPSAFDDNGARVAFTPSSTGNYFILGAGAIAPGSTSVSAIARMLADGTSIPFQSGASVEYWCREAPSAVTDAFYNFNGGTRKSLTGGASRTIEIEARNESGTTGTWQYTRVLCFREDAFTSSNYADIDTAAVDVNDTTTYVTRINTSTSAPPEAKDYLVIAGGFHGSGGDTAEAERTQAHILVAGAEVQMQEFVAKEATNPTDFLSFGHAIVRNDTASFTVQTQHRMQNLTDNASGHKNGWVMILRDDVFEGLQINVFDSVTVADVPEIVHTLCINPQETWGVRIFTP